MSERRAGTGRGIGRWSCTTGAQQVEEKSGRAAGNLWRAALFAAAGPAGVNRYLGLSNQLEWGKETAKSRREKESGRDNKYIERRALRSPACLSAHAHTTRAGGRWP